MPSLNDNEWTVDFLKRITDEEAQEQLSDPKRWSYIVRDPTGMVCAHGRSRSSESVRAMGSQIRGRAGRGDMAL